VIEPAWTWGSHAPDDWFADRANGSVMLRGYLALGAKTPEPSNADELSAWSGNFEGRDLHVMFLRGSPEIPSPITVQFARGQRLAMQRSENVARLRPGNYVVLSVPVHAHYRAVTEEMERAAIARLDAAAGILAVAISPNAVYQEAFEFITEASGVGAFVVSPAIRRPLEEHAELNEAAMLATRDVLRAIGAARERIQARALASLRWYSQAHADRNRLDAFVKFWIALEAISFGGNGSPRPLIDVLATHYRRDVAWVRDTFEINQLAQLRNDIVHVGERPMIHGHLVRFVDALYVDALRAKLGLPNERRAEYALPGAAPFCVRRWRNSGAVATAILPDAASGGVPSATPSGYRPGRYS
jgi:Apea-like HEPN